MVGPFGRIPADFQRGRDLVDLINSYSLNERFILAVCGTEIDGCIFFNLNNRGFNPLDFVKAVFKLQSLTFGGSRSQSYGAVDPVFRIAVDDELKRLYGEFRPLRRFGNISGVICGVNFPGPFSPGHIFKSDRGFPGNQRVCFRTVAVTDGILFNTGHIIGSSFPAQNNIFLVDLNCKTGGRRRSRVINGVGGACAPITFVSVEVKSLDPGIDVSNTLRQNISELSCRDGLSFKDIGKLPVGSDFNNISTDTVSAPIVPCLVPNKVCTVEVQSSDLFRISFIRQSVSNPFAVDQSIHPVIK